MLETSSSHDGHTSTGSVPIQELSHLHDKVLLNLLYYYETRGLEAKFASAIFQHDSLRAADALFRMFVVTGKILNQRLSKPAEVYLTRGRELMPGGSFKQLIVFLQYEAVPKIRAQPSSKPVKKLIQEDISLGTNEGQKRPGVIARLMGMESPPLNASTESIS